jgi:periplasmic protein TonB
MGGKVVAKSLIRKVNPSYPAEARQDRIQGTVRLHVIIVRDGSVQQVELISGHPLLAKAAIEAVRQWVYRPTLLNGEPVEVDTTVDVVFSLVQ